LTSISDSKADIPVENDIRPLQVEFYSDFPE